MSQISENINLKIFKNKIEPAYRLYFELTDDGYIKSALLEQFFVEKIPSKILITNKAKITNSFCSVENFSKEVKKQIREYIINFADKVKEENKTGKLGIKKKIGTTVIFPAELVNNTFYKTKIRNNYVSASQLEDKIAQHIDVLEDCTEIIPERKELINGNVKNKSVIKLDHMPRKLHKATLYVVKSFIDSGLYKWMTKTLHKNRYVGDIYMYSEIKGIRKAFSFFRINQDIQPVGENLVDWRDNYCLIISSTNDGFSKTKLTGGYQQLVSKLKEAFDIEDEAQFEQRIMNHKYHVSNEEDINYSALGKEYIGTKIDTKHGTLYLTDEEIQSTIQEVVKQQLAEINKITNNQEAIHFGKINHIDSFDTYLKRINAQEITNNYCLHVDFNKDFRNTQWVSKNILMFSLNEKKEYIKNYGNTIFNLKQKREVEQNMAANRIVGKILL